MSAAFASEIPTVNLREALADLTKQLYKGGVDYRVAVREFKRSFLATTIQENGGNQCKAARELGMHRNTLSRTADELKVDVRELRPKGKKQRDLFQRKAPGSVGRRPDRGMTIAV